MIMEDNQQEETVASFTSKTQTKTKVRFHKKKKYGNRIVGRNRKHVTVKGNFMAVPQKFTVGLSYVLTIPLSVHAPNN